MCSNNTIDKWAATWSCNYRRVPRWYCAICQFCIMHGDWLSCEKLFTVVPSQFLL